MRDNFMTLGVLSVLVLVTFASPAYSNDLCSRYLNGRGGEESRKEIEKADYRLIDERAFGSGTSALNIRAMDFAPSSETLALLSRASASKWELLFVDTATVRLKGSLTLPEVKFDLKGELEVQFSPDSSEVAVLFNQTVNRITMTLAKWDSSKPAAVYELTIKDPEHMISSARYLGKNKLALITSIRERTRSDSIEVYELDGNGKAVLLWKKALSDSLSKIVPSADSERVGVAWRDYSKSESRFSTWTAANGTKQLSFYDSRPVVEMLEDSAFTTWVLLRNQQVYVPKDGTSRGVISRSWGDKYFALAETPSKIAIFISTKE